MKLFSTLLSAGVLATGLHADDIGSAAAFVAAMADAPSGSHRLTANIDLTDSGFITVPEFSGTLDGNGFTISGVGKQPLIGILSGTVKNLTLDGMVGDARTTMSYGGSVAGYCLGALCLSNCCGRIEGSVVRGYKIYGTWRDSNSAPHYFGPFAARMLGSAVVTDCVSTNNIVGGDRSGKAGGLVGNATMVASLNGGPLIANCTNYSRLYGQTFSNGEYLGGIVGTFGGGKNKVAMITNCVNHGVLWVDANNKDISIGGISGGICGEQGATSSMTILVDCANRGEIKYDLSNAESNCGGIIGQVSEYASGFTLLRCVNYCDITLGSGVGGNASGIINYVDTEYKGSDFIVQDCANYGSITAPKGSAVGLVAGVRWHPDYRCGAKIRNCANYGALNGSAHANDYQLIKSVHNRKSTTVQIDCRNYVKFLNCFVTGSSLHVDPMSNTFTVTNCISSTDVGYDAQALCDKLNTEARANGWAKWAVGKSGYPEFKYLQPCSGLLVTIL